MNLRSFKVDRQKYLLSLCSGPKKILHIGCTNSPSTKYRYDKNILLHKLICQQGKNFGQIVVGIDIDKEAIFFLRERMPDERLVVGDAMKLENSLPGEKFNIIIAGDVIEHLPNPGKFLDSCRGALSFNGKLVISTANAFGLVRFSKAIFGHEAVHNEHTAYFSVNTLKQLASMYDFSIKRFGYYGLEKHFVKSGFNGFLSSLIESATSVFSPQLSEGLIVELSSTV